MNHFLSSFPIVSLSFSMNVALKGYIKTSVIFLPKTRFTTILDEGLKLWCAEQSVVQGDVQVSAVSPTQKHVKVRLKRPSVSLTET